MPSRAFCLPARAAVLLLLVLAAACGPAEQVPVVATPGPAPAPSVAGPVTPALPVTVSGVSSGAYMAVQVQVALADRVRGVASLAGGPYHCAQGSVTRAVGPCTEGGDIDAAALVQFARQAAAAGQIADPAHLAGSRVWLFNSPADDVVAPEVGQALADFFAAFADPLDVVRVTDVDAAHGWPTVDRGQSCQDVGGSFINACDYDAAGALLNHLLGELNPPAAGEPAGSVLRLDLSAYFSEGSSVAGEGLVFVPQECAAEPAACRLHISFHGCRQSAELVGEEFVRSVGLNEWAAANRIVVIYPQVTQTMLNPQGCWDWWGYTGDDYDLASGKQVAGVAALISAFAGGKLLPAAAN